MNNNSQTFLMVWCAQQSAAVPLQSAQLAVLHRDAQVSYSDTWVLFNLTRAPLRPEGRGGWDIAISLPNNCLSRTVDWIHSTMGFIKLMVPMPKRRLTASWTVEKGKKQTSNTSLTQTPNVSYKQGWLVKRICNNYIKGRVKIEEQSLANLGWIHTINKITDFYI